MELSLVRHGTTVVGAEREAFLDMYREISESQSAIAISLRQELMELQVIQLVLDIFLLTDRVESSFHHNEYFTNSCFTVKYIGFVVT